MLDRTLPALRPARATAPVARTVPDMFQRRVEQTPGGVAWKQKRSGNWAPTSWREFQRDAQAIATWLMSQGVGLGDKLTIVGSTRPEWCTCDVGGLLAGAVTVGAYPTLTAEQLAYIVDHSDSKVVFVEDRPQLQKLLDERAACPRLERIVVWNPEGSEDLLAAHDFVVTLAEVLGTAADEARVAERVKAIDPLATAIIVYTSGTTGPPKGAMISHENILVVLSTSSLMDFDVDDTGLSFLPMAHVAERVLGFYGRISYGTSTHFASSVPAVLEEVKEVAPTLFGSVPRIFEKAYARIQSEVEKASPAKQAVFRWAERTGLAVVAAWQRGESPGLGLGVQYRLADKLVFSRLRTAMFGGRVKYFITGAAPIPRQVLDFFWAAGFPIYEVYGMTEATVITHGNRPGATRLGSVGKPMTFVEDKLAEDGEILVRGKTVFQGYYKAPEATAETVDADGWLHTGDVGKRDADGYLYIVDRKKHIIITAGGKNITPANIENEIKSQDPLISLVHAHGDRRPYVTALITVGPLDAIELAERKGCAPDPSLLPELRRAVMENPLARPPGLTELTRAVTALPEVRERIKAAVERGNQKLGRVEQVKRVALLERDFSLDLDEITPTLKVKRKNIEQKFVETFDRLYADETFGIVIARGGGD